MALPRGGLTRFGRRSAATANGPAASELLGAMPVAMLAVDANGLVAEANIAAETLFNAALGAIVGRPLGSLAGHAASLIADGSPCAVYDVEMTLPDGRQQRVDLMAAPLPDRAGWMVVTIHQHVPPHLAGRTGNRAGGGLSAVGAAAMLAHEIKNPLSGIRGAAQLLEGTVDEDSRDLTRLIRDEVDRVAALIDRMEGFTDTRPLALGPQNIHAVLGRAREVALQGFARGRVIHEAYDPSLPAILGHQDSLIQVFINLMKNAAEASSGAITLRTAYRHGISLRGNRADQRHPLPIEVCVIDEGPGAPPHIADHLFDPFVTSKRSGGGLGLALVDKYVTDQGGIIEYAREGTPPRTIFRLLLQRANEVE